MESGRESGESGARRWAGRRGEGDGDGDGERDGLRRTSDFDGWDAASRGPGPRARGRGRGWIFVLDGLLLKRGVVVFVASVVGGAVGGVLRDESPVATARARRRTRAGLVAAPRRGRRCGAGGRRARAGAGAGGGRHREGLVGGIVAEVVVVHLLGDLGALGRRRHRVGTRCNHTPRRRTRGGGDGRARGGRSRRRARNPRCSRYARNRGSAARACVGVCVARGEDASRRGCRNVVVLTGERANGRYYFFIVLPPAHPRTHIWTPKVEACTQVRLAASPSLSPWDRHATTSSYKSRPSGAPRYAIRNDARLAYTTANPARSPAQYFNSSGVPSSPTTGTPSLVRLPAPDVTNLVAIGGVPPGVVAAVAGTTCCKL